MQISDHLGYAENQPDPNDGLLHNTQDVSFSATGNMTGADTYNEGGVSANKSWLNFYVRDYAAAAKFKPPVSRYRPYR